jgi:hypothetical protein
MRSYHTTLTPHRASGRCHGMTLGRSSPGIPALLRTPLVLSGILLLSIGLAETLAGRVKIGEYQTILQQAPPVVAKNPAALFPMATEEQEARELAEAKLAYYHLLLTAGQLLSGVGLILFAAGLLRGHRPSHRSELTSA